MTPWICISEDRTNSAQREGAAPSRAETASNRFRQEIERCFLEFREQAFRYLRALGCEHSMAEEFTQESFLRLYRAMQAGPRVNDERAWILRVARNLYFDSRREHQRYQAAREDGANQRTNNPRDSRPDPGPDPEQQVIQRERARRIAEEVERLPELERECMHLRTQGLRYREIALTLGITLPAAADCIRRAVKRLGSIVSE